jgi:hypothetical protein
MSETFNFLSNWTNHGLGNLLLTDASLISITQTNSSLQVMNDILIAIYDSNTRDTSNNGVYYTYTNNLSTTDVPSLTYINNTSQITEISYLLDNTGKTYLIYTGNDNNIYYLTPTLLEQNINNVNGVTGIQIDNIMINPINPNVTTTTTTMNQRQKKVSESGDSNIGFYRTFGDNSTIFLLNFANDITYLTQTIKIYIDANYNINYNIYSATQSTQTTFLGFAIYSFSLLQNPRRTQSGVQNIIGGGGGGAGFSGSPSPSTNILNNTQVISLNNNTFSLYSVCIDINGNIHVYDITLSDSNNTMDIADHIMSTIYDNQGNYYQPMYVTTFYDANGNIKSYIVVEVLSVYDIIAYYYMYEYVGNSINVISTTPDVTLNIWNPVFSYVNNKISLNFSNIPIFFYLYENIIIYIYLNNSNNNFYLLGYDLSQISNSQVQISLSNSIQINPNFTFATNYPVNDSKFYISVTDSFSTTTESNSDPNIDIYIFDLTNLISTSTTTSTTNPITSTTSHLTTTTTTNPTTSSTTSTTVHSSSSTTSSTTSTTTSQSPTSTTSTTSTTSNTTIAVTNPPCNNDFLNYLVKVLTCSTY